MFLFIFFFTSGFLWENTRVLDRFLYFYDGIHVSKRYDGWAGHSVAFWVYLHLLRSMSIHLTLSDRTFQYTKRRPYNTYAFRHLPPLSFSH